MRRNSLVLTKLFIGIIEIIYGQNHIPPLTNRLPVLAKLYTRFDEFEYRNLTLWQCIHTYKTCISLFGIFSNHIPVLRLTKLYTDIDKILYQYWGNFIPVLAKSYWWNHIPRKRVGLFPIPVNIGIQFGKYWRRYIFKDLGRFKVENKDYKTWGLRNLPRYGIKNKKKVDFATQVSL